MRDDVYEDKTVSFHWNLNEIVETKFKRIGSTSTPSPDQLPGVDEDSSGDPRSNHRYELNTFVVVRTGGTEHDLDFWLGQVVDTHQASSGVVSELTVRWFEFYQSSDIYRAKHRPMMTNNKQNKYWTGKISVDSVHIQFSNLLSDKRLPTSVSNHLRTVCSSLSKR